MNTRWFGLTAALVLAMVSAARAQGPTIPPGDKEPLLRLEAEGPTSFVTALTFSPDGKRLYAAGFDKVVRVWTLNAQDKFALNKASYRVPIGPGIDGSINAVALSPDEKWLAVAGQGIVRGAADFRTPGLVIPKTGAFTEAMWRDMGTIYVFNTQTKAVHLLRGHMGPVWTLAFAPPHKGKAPLLVSAGRDRDMRTNSYTGSVRVWNLDKKEESKPLAVRSDMPSYEGRPGLAIRHTGNGEKELQVALAWEASLSEPLGKLRLWDVAANRVREASDGWNGEKPGMSNNTAAMADAEHVVSCSRSFGRQNEPGAAQFRKWRLTAEGLKQVDGANFSPEAGDFPRALSLASSRAGGAADLAAIVLVKQVKSNYQHLLNLAALTGEFGEIKSRILLWEVSRADSTLPAIACAVGGRFLAVAGKGDHSIHVYRIADLLAQPETARPQILHSVGMPFQFAAFVRKEKERGVLLGRSPKTYYGGRPRDPMQGDVVFHLDKRAFSTQLDGWELDTPNVEGWDVRHEIVEGRTVVRVRHGDAGAVEIKLLPGEVVNDYALLPAMPPLNVPIVAIAFHERGQPLLRLYNAGTGEEVRWYTGHTERLHNMAFSGDGRFLVSVADDLTVNVWSMSKLDKYMPKLGRIPGLSVKNAIVVSAVQKGSPAQGKVQEFDVIEGLVDANGKLHPTVALPALFRRISETTPGRSVTLRLRTPGGTDKNHEVVVGQNLTDESRAMLLGFGSQDPLLAAILLNGARQFSPLPGLSLRHAPMVVLSPFDKLAKDDVIEGLVERNEVRVIPSAFKLYEAIALAGPRTKVTLRVRGKGDVVVPVGQGIDERKPLFSLFVTGGRRVAQWEWIGWSPIGPYEASDRQAERYIGWHFNTGDPQAPATFALADQYRKEYYREGILRHLIARGDLAAALKDWEDQDRRKSLPMPRMTLWIDEVGPDPAQLNGLGQFVIRDLPAQLKLALDDFPLDKVESLEYEVNGGPRHKFPQDYPSRERSVGLDLKRGVSRIKVILRTFEAQAQEFQKEIVVRVVPPAPLVKAAVPARQVVNAPAFPLKALVRAGRLDQEVQITLLHKKNEEIVKKFDFVLAKNARELNIEEKLELKPGDNLVEVVAVNKEALPDREELETQRFSSLITYVPPLVKAPPPLITLEQVVPVSRETVVLKGVPVVPGQPVVVDEPTVRLVGRVEAKERLEQSEWRTKSKSGQLDVTDKERLATLPLEPGEQKVTLTARTASSDASELTLMVVYRPSLPRVSVTAQAQPIYVEGADAARVKVEGVFVATNEAPAEAELLLNDKPAGKLAARAGDWSAWVEGLRPGDNRIQVRLHNAWERMSTSEAVHVRYLRPPYDIRFEPAQVKSDKPLVDLTASVRSPLPLIRETVEAEVNGREIVSVQVDKTHADTWKIQLKNVPLEAKDNEVNLWVSNLESRCRKPGKARVRYVPPMAPPSRAEVELLSPMKDLNVTEADLPVRFRVQSKSALHRVELIRDNVRQPLRETFQVAGLKPNAQGYYEFQKVIKLVPQENRLRVLALNDGGEQDASVVVNYLYMPVRLTIDRLQPLAGQGPPIEPRVFPDGKLVFPTVPNGRVTLYGRVTWSKDNDEQLKKISLVRVYVNGFQQIPAELKPPVGAGRERAFRAELLLNRPDNNQVEIELPDLKQDSSNRRDFPLACAKPEPGQRLHLLIVGIGEKDEKKLIDQALLALRASKDKDQIKTPAFSQVRVYGPLTDFVSPEQVFTQLCLIKKTIDVLASEGSPNDVAMVYYQGGEALKSDGNFFETSVSKYDKELKRSGMSFRGLQGFFDETLGGKILMLDVARVVGDKEVKDEVARVAPNTYFSILRYKWLNSTARNGGLLTDWKKAMDTDKVGVLETVTTQVSDYFKQHPSLSYDHFVPTGLANLQVDEKQKR